MLWLSRPPYLRWFAVVVVVGASLWADFGPRPTSRHPVAAVDLPGGEVTESDVQWVEVPAGILPPVDLPATLSGPVAAGEPLRPSDLADSGAGAPAGWWSVEVEVPEGTPTGTEVRLAAADLVTGAATVVPGIVVGPGRDGGGITGGATALVAVPEDQLGLVAVARSEGRLTVAVGR